MHKCVWATTSSHIPTHIRTNIFDLFVYKFKYNATFNIYSSLDYTITVIQIQILYVFKVAQCEFHHHSLNGFCVSNIMLLPTRPLTHTFDPYIIIIIIETSPNETKCAFVFNFITKYILIIAINNAIIPSSGSLCCHIEARTHKHTHLYAHSNNSAWFTIFSQVLPSAMLSSIHV